MKTHLMSLIVPLIALLAGCQSNSSAPSVPSVGPMEAGGFVQQWESALQLAGDKITALYLEKEILFAYTQQNYVYALSAAGGKILWIHRIGNPGDQILPPLVLEKGLTVIPAVSTMHKISMSGQTETPLEIGHSIRSPITGEGQFVYCGLDFANGGHFAKIDITKKLNFAVWEFMSRSGFSAAPVFFQNIIYVAGEDGVVYAVNEARAPVWPLPGGVFRTEGRILADLKVDLAGVYVASTDTKLYCLDPQTGKIKWQYFPGVSLTDSPVPTAETVYQFVRGVGLAAIDKTTSEYNRKPKWIAGNASAFLAEDATYAYLRDLNNGIIGVDKKTGEEKFRNRRNDFVAFATNPTGDVVFASTAGGQVLAIKPVTKSGVVGQMAKVELEFEAVAMGR